MQVGYLGVGNMGQPMAEKLLDGGHGLVVYDISEAATEPLLLRQARRANSPKEIADLCEIVAVSLPTLAAFRAAVLGPDGLAAGHAMKVLLNTCTVGVPFLHEIEAALAPQGVKIVDCPISDGPAGARRNTLGHGLGRPGGGRESAVTRDAENAIESSNRARSQRRRKRLGRRIHLGPDGLQSGNYVGGDDFCKPRYLSPLQLD
jgi:3-hydroxyisobutyrate dehydrogenase-like beta-hydroxyacid dehydrogenase